MKKLAAFGVVLIAVLAWAPARAETGRSESANKDPAWAARMRRIQKAAGEMLADVSSDQRFNAKANFKRIEANARVLAENAHDLSKVGAAAPDADPSVKLLSTLFANEAKHAYTTLKAGHRPYARTVLRSLTGYCVACHSRTQSGDAPTGAGVAAFAPPVSLERLEKADFLAASRQFTQALDAYEALVADDVFLASRQLEWERAVNQVVVLSVRVAQDPARTQRVLERVVAARDIPFYLRERARAWLVSVKEWKDEGARELRTDEGLYAEATRLMARARDLQKYPVDRNGDIYFLRASATVHRLLKTSPQSRFASRGYFMAGVAYEIMRGLTIGDLAELFYQACIYQEPHSEIARSCYQRLEEYIHAGYTGSGGTHVPSELSRTLRELQKLAEAEVGEKAPAPQ